MSSHHLPRQLRALHGEVAARSDVTAASLKAELEAVSKLIEHTHNTRPDVLKQFQLVPHPMAVTDDRGDRCRCCGRPFKPG